MAISRVQGALRSAKSRAGINQRAVSVHPLRHSYAPPPGSRCEPASHPAEPRTRPSGDDEGLSSPDHKGQEEAVARINELMADL